MKNILLGVTGGIAAYKSPDLVRRLVERGAEVQVAMTAGARRFVTPLTFQAVSGRPVRDDLWDEDGEAAMGHIELARWADEILVAPASADFMARLAAGAAPDLLSTLCLATEAPITLAPAMNRLMWVNPATRANRELLAARGVRFLGPAAGDQACGEIGAGRMLEPLEIAEAVMRRAGDGRLAGRRVMITAGPTREPLDPVRYLTNRSSGKMGFALARAALAEGAEVLLVCGPVSLATPPGAERVDVETADEMYAAVEERIGEVDVFIGAAAIADYRPAERSSRKIKKSADSMRLELVKAPDTLAAVAARRAGPFTVGFAAETNDLRKYALGKLAAKKLDMIVANRVGEGRGFDADENAVTVFWRGGEQSYDTMEKAALARELVALVAERFEAASAARRAEPGA